MELESVTTWIGKVRSGDGEAARKLWLRYFESLAQFAKTKLPHYLKQMADEEDVALSTLESLMDGLQNGEFDAVHNRYDLWQVLTLIAARKAQNHIKFETRQKRDSRRKRGDSGLANISDPKDDPKNDLFRDPAWLAQFAESCEIYFQALPSDTMRMIAGMRLEGFCVSEMAKYFGVSERTIERKLKLVRTIWLEMMKEQS